ncbi:MAG: HAD family phosphatase [Bacteroidales bacterium]|nr:HAD family phosphatase [Bacteroidales bacterium]
MIKNIIFDLGGVIVRLDRNACVNSFRKIGFQDFGTILNDFVQHGFFLDFEKGIIDAVQFRDVIRKYIGGYVTDEEIDNAMADFLAEIPGYKLKLICRLKQSYNVYLLSNTNPIAMNQVRVLFRNLGYEMDDCFHKMFLSYEMKMAKPDAEIFEKLISETGIIPGESLFVDDGSLNIQTARSLGFQTLLASQECDLEKEVLDLL